MRQSAPYSEFTFMGCSVAIIQWPTYFGQGGKNGNKSSWTMAPLGGDLANLHRTITCRAKIPSKLTFRRVVGQLACLKWNRAK